MAAVRRLTSLSIITLASASLLAHAPAAPSFDVASVKPNHSVETQTVSITQPGGRYTASNMTLRALIKTAYGMHDDQLTGGPDWIDKDRFDIAAKAEGFTGAAEFRDTARLMLRPLLADRFGLVLRRERRELPVYALVRVSPDALGPQMQRSDPATCGQEKKAMEPAAGTTEEAVELICGAEVYYPGHLVARAMPLSIFVRNLSRWTDHLVIDASGLGGKFDWDLQWTPETPLTSDGPIVVAGASLFGALRAQSGFRLDRQRAVVDMFFVEKADRPGPD